MEGDKEKKTEAFSRVVDATSNFLKEIFPHAYSFIQKIKEKKIIEKPIDTNSSK
jgi:hypothetical protein